ncbi:phage baseplate plug protein [Pseudoleptotrichia goodfellowii]|jgi:hypothetical protein|uniref:Cyanophage baseplate Pam3 plug gp18 domain-containing protein n=1 Tax=Pseudoleptotrichia goodfellowii F0264 TaxID=596323 RepID=D0GNW9_9FUSO|nr:hypothetical protein [Pseudoleptotrichia goodfellowii]EEY34225.1 hypothetical protein HMPREF0554_0822 [Pseudoleptotrichia goodfellowii F0264]DAN70599.1 MAG TPA: hypothetical protein [Caudoviricetes sp.]
MRINLDKSLIPLKFTLRVLDENFQLHFKEHKMLINDDELNPIFKSRLYLDIYNEDNKLILKNEKLVYGVPVGLYLSRDKNNNTSTDFPNAYIFPFSNDGIEKEVNFDNLNNTVFIEFIERE